MEYVVFYRRGNGKLSSLWVTSKNIATAERFVFETSGILALKTISLKYRNKINDTDYRDFGNVNELMKEIIEYIKE